jgi:Flp pilus assembly protein TadG
MRRRNSKNGQRFGAAAVELALVIPILLFVVMAAVETCDLVFLRQSLKISAYEGARISIVPGATTYDIEYQVAEIAAARNLDNPTVTITPSNFEDLSSGEFVTVEVTVDTKNRTYFSNLITETKRSASVSMMKEN